MKNSWICILLILPFIFACSSYKHIAYLNPLPEGKDTIFNQKRPVYHLQPSDILYVRIISNNKEVSDLYNPLMSGSGSAANISQLGGMYILGFIVSDSGTVNLPILGRVEVEGLTIDESQERIQSITNKYLTDALAVVKLAQYKFTVLGEVNSPGYKVAQSDRLNIFEAISLAGDLTYSSKRNKVLVIRQELIPEKADKSVSGLGKNEMQANILPHRLSTHTYQVDLTSPNILSSEAYFIQPNDIIYVKPTFLRAIRVTTGDYLLMLGSITSTITAIFLITKL
jgi:polysaccharide export outer membrane protein